MIRKIISINQELCNGCGACAAACHEGAIGMVNGKAQLLRDDYCDGLGDCLPTCPTGAISFVEREAAAYDAAAVQAAHQMQAPEVPCGCPGSRPQTLTQQDPASSSIGPISKATSQLRQWPVQIQLAPIRAPYFQKANLLIAADCSAYAYGAFHEDFIRGHVVLVGCPKLDQVDYAEKLTEILRHNDIKSIHIVRMEVPCCGGLEQAVKTALQHCGKFLPWQVTTLSVDGTPLD